MATFHENLVQSFKNFKNKYIGNTSIAGIGDGTLTSAVSEINQHLSEHTLGSVVDLSSYKQANPYIAPCDGYLRVANNSGETGYVYLNDTIGIGGTQGGFAMFVRKGSSLYSSMATSFRAQFLPLT